MRISELIEAWEPGDWPALKLILIELAADIEYAGLSSKSEDKG